MMSIASGGPDVARRKLLRAVWEVSHGLSASTLNPASCRARDGCKLVGVSPGQHDDVAAPFLDEGGSKDRLLREPALASESG